ncbi:glycosyltransferase family 2 protein [Actinobacillus equuli]|uniref:glycosyltransferase family 2 protein n=1 Tax=Actinobacillus equuli TaxID=718 RepID=UPI0024423DE0|nr:hypothetical protein [Actinobacillus equuli]WGE75307.1 hypothetical protein NYR81_10430 [Actinobacillus equuli subsp. haemolyticus]WGE77221.1 hypothetical protein NYR82_10425 [Actinobacillus equuli subsp. haemolyticus]
MNSKVAIVIRYYSPRKQFLYRLLDSLNKQSNIENLLICILRMDNKPMNVDLNYYNTDNSQELFQYLDSQSVQYISILDDDDTLAPDFLSRTLSVMGNIHFPSVKAITTHINKVFELCEGNRIRILRTEPLNHHLKYGILALDTLRYKDTLRLSSCLFEYESFKSICYRHNLREPSFFWPFIIDFGAFFDIWLLEEAMAFYHIREFPEFSSANYEDKHIEMSNIYIRAKLNELYRSNQYNFALLEILRRVMFP